MSRALAENLAKAILIDLLGDKAPEIDASKYLSTLSCVNPGEVILEEDLFNKLPSFCAMNLAAIAIDEWLNTNSGEMVNKEVECLDYIQDGLKHLFWGWFWRKAEVRQHKKIGVRLSSGIPVVVGYTEAVAPPISEETKKEIQAILGGMEEQLTSANANEKRRLIKDAIGHLIPKGVTVEVFDIKLGNLA